MSTVDDEVCFCFHVRRQQVAILFDRHPDLQLPQIATRFGAGTACGCCQKRLEKVLAELRTAAAKHAKPPPSVAPFC